ncbi:MAG: restriction endonuclease subunit S [Alphaproteobacteria bacterium]|nr:restriction endonuclease subunit S [Alphaproteobacteria bacterium]
MTSWQEVKLGDICEITSSKRIFMADYVALGIPFYRSKEIIEKQRGNDISTELFITEEKYEEIKQKFSVPQEGDILLTSVGTLGIPYVVRKNERFYFKDGNLTWIKKSNSLLPKYLYYFFISSEGKLKLENISIGTTQKAITIVGLKSLEIPLPPFDVQKKIAGVLGALDDKIELNNKINNNLEQQAQALYVNNIELYKERNIKVEDIVITANTGADAIQKAPIVDYDTGVKCVRVGDMSNKRSYSDWGYAKVTDDVFFQYQLKKDDIIVTRTASLGLNTIISKNLDAVYNNGLIRLTINKDVIVPLLVYRQFQTDDFKNYISKIEGETSVRPNMKINYLLQYSFAVMNKEKQKELIKVLEPLWNKQEQLIEENTRLAAIRDALLPKLMSGEIDVSNVDISALTSTDKLSFTK